MTLDLVPELVSALVSSFPSWSLGGHSISRHRIDIPGGDRRQILVTLVPSIKKGQPSPSSCCVFEASACVSVPSTVSHACPHPYKESLGKVENGKGKEYCGVSL